MYRRSLTLAEAAKIVGGRVVGDVDFRIERFASLEKAQPADTSLYLGERFEHVLRNTKAGAVVCGRELEHIAAHQLIVESPHLAFARLMRELAPPSPARAERHPTAFVHEDAHIGADVFIGPFCHIDAEARIGSGCRFISHVYVGKDVHVGEKCLFHSHVTVREGCRIGNRVILQDGCRIGSDGYGFARNEHGCYEKIPQLGIVRIEDDVEIGANACVDRATFGETVVGRGTKTDNLVQVGHNCFIGGDCLLVAQVGLAGSVELEDHVTLAGQVGVSDHLHIGSGAIVGGKSGVTRDVPGHATYTGYPAMEHKEWKKLQAMLKNMVQTEKMRGKRTSR